MVRNGFPVEHMEALRNARPGSSVVTDIAGTRVQEPSQSGNRIRDDGTLSGRLFNPSYSTAWTGASTPATLIRYNTAKQVSNTLYSTVYEPTELVAMDTTVAIFVDGACRDNGKASATAAYGVFFGAGSKYNKNGLVDSGQKQTSQVAEIIAVLKALEVLNKVWETMGVMEVVVITDSDYVVKCMCGYLGKWLRNGFRTSKGTKVENEGLLRNLNDRINELDEEGIEVKFWRVDRSLNQKADALAKGALNSDPGLEGLS